MKKTGNNSTGKHMKLRLHRDTLRQLTSLDLKEVVGGSNATGDFECEFTYSLNCVPR